MTLCTRTGNLMPTAMFPCTVWILMILLSLMYGTSFVSTHVDDGIESIIYSTQNKFCGSRVCNANKSFEPPLCDDQKDVSTIFDPITNMTFLIEQGPSRRQKDPPCAECSCSNDCEVFGDCCVDKSIGSEIFFECESIFLHVEGGAQISYVMLSKRCPEDSRNFSQELAEKCEHGKLGQLDDGRMVNSYIGDTRVTFRNKYCAECHGQTDYTPWNVYVSCDNDFIPGNYSDMNEFIRSITENHQCMLTTAHELAGHSEMCFLHMDLVSSCNVTGDWKTYNETIETACLSYINPVLKFRNIFCAICNGMDEEELMCIEDHKILPHNPTLIVPFSAILNFENNDIKLVDGSNNNFHVARIGQQELHQCREGDMFDTLSKRCREVYCPIVVTADNITCVDLISSENTVLTTWKLDLFYLKPLIFPYGMSNFGIGDIALSSVDDYLKENSSFNIFESSVVDLASIYSAFSLSVVVSEIDLGLIVNGESLLAARQGLKSVSNFSLSMTWNGEAVGIDVLIVGNSRSMQAKYLTSVASLSRNSPPGPQSRMRDMVHVPLEFNDSCPMVRYQSYEVVMVNKTLNIGNRKLLSEDYIKKGNYFYVCVEDVNDDDRVNNIPSHGSEIEQLLTLICFSCSISFLVITLLVYMCIRKLHTIPGLNLILLCLSLLVAQLLYLFGAGAVSEPTVCTIIGVLIHYFWLVAFAWMNICCFHMFRVFKNLFKSLDYAEEKRSIMLKYSVFGFGIPALIVATTTVTSYITSDHRTIGYGGPSLCFVASGWTSVISFGIPAGVTVLSNTVLLIYTMVKLRQTNNSETGSKGRNRADNISRFFKLSTMTGLSWLFGFLGYFLQRVEFLYVFTVLTASQGVFIFLSFVLSRRIWRMLREQCCQKDQRAGSYVKSPQVTENTYSNATLKS